MVIDTNELIASLRLVTGQGALQSVIINLDGSLTAVFTGGLVQFDRDGKVRKP